MLGFFFYCGKNKRFFVLRKLFYIFFLFLRKLKLISNLKLKNQGLKIFVSGFKEIYLKQLSQEYSKKIALKKSTLKKLESYNPNKWNVYIITASFINYVEPLFPKHKVIGSELKFTKKKIGLKSHCYKEEKVNELKKLGINKIDVLFTDSLNDLPLAELAQEINLVMGNVIIPSNNVENFIEAFEQNKNNDFKMLKISKFIHLFFKSKY